MTHHKEKVSVIGLGYIGLPTAVFFARSGYEVVGVDTNDSIVNAVREDRIEVKEPGLTDLLREVIQSGSFTASSRVSESDVFVIAVPTPFDSKLRVDPKFVYEAADSIAPVLTKGALVILESTSPPGLTESVELRLRNQRPELFETEDRPLFAHCPERVLPGNILEEMVNNVRIVGGTSELAASKAAKHYSTFCDAAIHQTDAKTAEAVKLAENSFRDVNIAFANELSLISDRIGVDVWELISLANLHPRVNILQPSAGVGGHCIAVDPWFLYSAAPDEARLIRTAREVNDFKPVKVAAQISQHLPENGEIGLLGLTFKPDVDDIRESPAIEVVRQLAKNNQGTKIWVYEPQLSELPKSLTEIGNVVNAGSISEICDSTNVIGILVRHSRFAADLGTLSEFDGPIIDAVGLTHSRG